MGSEYSWAVDALIIVLVVVSAYLAMVRGFFRELFALASWVIAFFAAFFLAPVVYPHLASIPGVGGILRDCNLGLILSFVVVFGAALIVSGVVIWMFSTPNHYTAVSVVDQLLGLGYGALRGLVLVAVLVIVYQEFVSSGAEKFDVVESAATYPYVEQVAGYIRQYAPSELPDWVTERVQEAQSDCAAAQSGFGA